MIIAHYKQTPIARAPEAISDIINKYSEHSSFVFGHGYPKTNDFKKSDIVHQHNLDVIDHGKKILQYHSEPFRVHLNVKIKKLVIAQYHATLPEYRGCEIVRNPIDLYDEIFLPKYQSSKIKIGYSPSTLNPSSSWADKGYSETIPILNSIKNRFGNLIDLDIITGVSLEECLARKSVCNIFIDEVKTVSYHRSGLESLGMGIATICSIGPEVEKVLLNSSNSQTNPFINVSISNLENKLVELIDSGIYSILEKGYNSRLWMEKHWNPKTIADEYINIYKKL